VIDGIGWLQSLLLAKANKDLLYCRKLTYFGHTTRKDDSLEKDIITGTLPGKWARDRSKTSWMNNIIAWTGLMLDGILRKTEERSEWRAFIWRVVNLRIEERLKEEKEEEEYLVACDEA